MDLNELRQHFEKAAESGQVSHAYIFEGDPVDTEELAGEFAKLLVRSPADLIFPRHEKPGLFSVDDVRENITKSISIRPYGNGKKVYVIRDSEKMNVQAQNALLKTIEEPPEYAVVILLTENSSSFLDTILSRCVKMRIPEGVRKATEEEKEAEAIVFGLLRLGRDMNTEKLLKGVQELVGIKQSADHVLDCMRRFFRDVMAVKCGASKNLLLLPSEFSSERMYAGAISFEGIERILVSIDDAEHKIDANVNFELTMEYLWIGIREEL